MNINFRAYGHRAEGVFGSFFVVSQETFIHNHVIHSYTATKARTFIIMQKTSRSVSFVSTDPIFQQASWSKVM